jgi:hypothetical protein
MPAQRNTSLLPRNCLIAGRWQIRSPGEARDQWKEPRAIRLIEERWTVIRHAVEAIAIVLAGLWGLYVFVYIVVCALTPLPAA